jgi:serine/threonine protein kinase
MYGDVTYGKPIDIWAVGIIMYEIISGVHPTWQKGEDKSSYREKMKSFKKITFNSPRFTS